MLKLCGLLCLFLLPNCYAKITVVTENFPRFQYLNEQGELVGSAAEKVLRALASSGIEYSLLVNNWSISYNSALRDTNTCIFSAARLPAREDKLLWIAKLEEFTASFYSFKSKQLTLNSLEQAKQYRIAVLKDNYSHQYLLEQGFSEYEQLIVLNSFDNIYEILKSRRASIDLVALSDQEVAYQLQKDRSLAELIPVMPVASSQPPLYFACNKNLNTVLLEKLTTAFKQL
ncbi:substrate-binding periplasmic protein [Pseudoalteromonas mariniglutinosa]|uniref:substrate-binding periplasmic protein n=1 Tax=Pseudoalteromonas mariniglutinosa TaxID=206042 RepID=UPI00384E8492